MTKVRSIFSPLVAAFVLLTFAMPDDALSQNDQRSSGYDSINRPTVQPQQPSKDQAPTLTELQKQKTATLHPDKSRLDSGPSTSPRVIPASLESPLARKLRDEMVVNPAFRIGPGQRTSRTPRAVYQMRNRINERKSQQESGAQTLKELLDEIDATPSSISPAREKTPTPLIQQPDNDQSFDIGAARNGQGEILIEGQPSSASTESFGIAKPTQFFGAELANFERMALENHPTLNSALAKIMTARHEALQAGLHPNPNLGLFIDEAGNENNPGLWGAYLQRKHIRGNKLALGREIKNREATVLEANFETQVTRLKTDVKTAYYKLLIAREKFVLTSQLYKAQQDAITKSDELFKAGETPKTDLLQTELQSQKTLILLSQNEIAQQNAWRELAAVVGQPDLPFQQIVGDLNPLTQRVSFEECLSYILTYSPELLAAEAEVYRVRATIDRELAETIPNYQTQFTIGRDSTTNHFFTGVQLQIPLQVCDQNQGNIAAAKTRLVAAQNEMERIKLNLSKRLSKEYQQYQSALVKSEMFTEKLFPKSKQTLDLLSAGYPDDVSFLQLLTAQQTVIEITLEYLDTLSLVWQSRLKIEGLLLDDSLSK